MRSGYLPRDEVAEAWELIESALLDHGLLGSGAIGPNEIVVFAPDPDEAREVVDALPIQSTRTGTLAHDAAPTPRFATAGVE